MPAGTGVWVVKTLLMRIASTASSKDRPCRSMNSRIRSIARKAECPSFMWKTVGLKSSSSRARMPPSIGVQILPEITELIQQCHADQRQVVVARGLHVIARQDTEPAGIDRYTFRQPVFG